MPGKRTFHILLALLCLCILLTACNSPSAAPSSNTKAKGAAPTATSSPVATQLLTPLHPTTTLPVPPTEDTCPPSGAGREMITAPLVLGTQPAIVYAHNTGTYDNPVSGELLRYDVATGQTKTLLVVQKAGIYGPQISADRQWVLFTIVTGAKERISELQMVRMDGQGLQTLYCSPNYSIQHPLWSPTEQYIAFYNMVNNHGTIFVLDTTTGFVQTTLTMPNTIGAVLHTWLDPTHLAFSETASDTTFGHIFLLDVTIPNQQYSDLTIALQQQYGDFDVLPTPTGPQLLISYGGCANSECIGPSSIKEKPTDGTTQRTIYDSNLYDVIQVRDLSEHSLLFIIGNTDTGTSTSDTSENGLWKIGTDGSGLVRLLPTTPTEYSFFNYNTQEPGANVSLDGSMYALQINSFKPDGTQINTLVYGSVNGGDAKTFATTDDNSQLQLVGWTTM